jgi:integrase
MRKRLTEIGVERMKPTLGKQIDVYDQGLTGLLLRVNPGGTKTWRAIYYVNGRARSYKLGRWPIMSLKQARDAARVFLIDPQERIDANESELFGEAVIQFINRYAKQNRSWRQTAGYLGLLVDPKNPDDFIATRIGLAHRWRDKRLDAITPKDVNRELNRIVDRGSPYASNRFFSNLRKFFNWAIGEAMIQSSPCVGIKAKTKEVSRDRVLNDDELKTVWEAAETTLRWPWREYIKVLMLTAQRRAEVSKMRWRDIDLDNATWTIPREMTKADRTHVVPLSDQVVEIIKAVPRFRGEYIFSTTEGEKPIAAFGQIKTKLDKIVGIEPWRFHDLRRTAATNIAMLGVPPQVLAAVINHSQKSVQGVTSLYNRHAYEEEKRMALQKWADRLDIIIKGQEKNVIAFTRTK